MSKLGDPHKKVTRVKWQFVVYLISLDTPRRPVLHIVVFIDITWIYERLRRHRMVAKQITIKTAGTCPLIYSKFSCFINTCIFSVFTTNGTRCNFPFVSEGVTYTGCTAEGLYGGAGNPTWCATVPDLDAEPGNWGACDLRGKFWPGIHTFSAMLF